jgi:hypothetical protein
MLFVGNVATSETRIEKTGISKMSKTIRRFEAKDFLRDPPTKQKGRGRQDIYELLGQRIETLVTARGEVFWRYAGVQNWTLAADTVSGGCAPFLSAFFNWVGGGIR